AVLDVNKFFAANFVWLQSIAVSGFTGSEMHSKLEACQKNAKIAAAFSHQITLAASEVSNLISGQIMLRA
ncbi:MAG: hypothetical protein K2X81_12260, partial [Candidatus Obscuribacterales bacterium]|nr:hypothetical protein [Candidatus Obscuribacterales bacterium]